MQTPICKLEDWFYDYARVTNKKGILETSWTLYPGADRYVLFRAEDCLAHSIANAYTKNGAVITLTDTDMFNMASMGARIVASLYEDHGAPTVKFFAAPDASLLSASSWRLDDLLTSYPMSKNITLSQPIDFIPLSITIAGVKAKHELKEYVGAWEVFNYCVHCGKPEKEIGDSPCQKS